MTLLGKDVYRKYNPNEPYMKGLDKSIVKEHERFLGLSQNGKSPRLRVLCNIASKISRWATNNNGWPDRYEVPEP